MIYLCIPRKESTIEQTTATHICFSLSLSTSWKSVAKNKHGLTACLFSPVLSVLNLHPYYLSILPFHLDPFFIARYFIAFCIDAPDENPFMSRNPMEYSSYCYLPSKQQIRKPISNAFYCFLTFFLLLLRYHNWITIKIWVWFLTRQSEQFHWKRKKTILLPNAWKQ